MAAPTSTRHTPRCQGSGSGAPLELLQALTMVGAQTWDDYLSKIHQRKQSTYTPRTNTTITADRPVEDEASVASRRAHLPSSEGFSRSPDPTQLTPDTRPAQVEGNLATPADPFSYLTISPTSRLGKKLCFTRTGHVRELLQLEAARVACKDRMLADPHRGAAQTTAASSAATGRAPALQSHPVCRLIEFAQQAGLETPVFSSVSKNGTYCSPDHYVTLVFEGHTFSDEEGKRSIKAGKQCVAQKALDYFLLGHTGGSSDHSTSGNLISSSSSNVNAHHQSPSASPSALLSNPVGALYEYAQRLGCAPPQFESEARQGCNPSPDHYVTLYFSVYNVRDGKGRRSLKLGREAVALRACEFFFGLGLGEPGRFGAGLSERTSSVFVE